MVKQNMYAVLLLCLTGGTAQAALIDRGNGLIYDSILDATWLQNANLAATESFGVVGINVDGSMNWDTANSWIAAMNDAKNLGYNDWRLPTLKPVNGIAFNYFFSFDGITDIGYNITSPNAELAYMYYVNLSNYGTYSPGTGGDSTGCGNNCLSNTGLFDNLQSEYLSGYWYGVAGEGTESAWAFNTSVGSQGYPIKYAVKYAWAVRSGDVTSTNVPEPDLWALLTVGLLAFGRYRCSKIG